MSVCSTYPLMRAKVWRSCGCPLIKMSPVVLPAPDAPISAVIFPVSNTALTLLMSCFVSFTFPDSVFISTSTEYPRRLVRDAFKDGEGCRVAAGMVTPPQVQPHLRVELCLARLRFVRPAPLVDYRGLHVLQPPVVQAEGVDHLGEDDEADDVDAAHPDPVGLRRDGKRREEDVPPPRVGSGSDLVIVSVLPRGLELVQRQDLEDPRGRHDPVDPDEEVRDRRLGHHRCEADGQAVRAGGGASVRGDGLEHVGEGEADEEESHEEDGEGGRLEADEEEGDDSDDDHFEHLDREPGRVVAGVLVLVEDSSLRCCDIDYVHVAHGQDGSQHEQHGDLQPRVGSLPEDGSDQDRLHDSLDEDPPQQHDVLELHFHRPGQRRSHQGPPGSSVHVSPRLHVDRVVRGVSPCLCGELEARLYVRVVQSRSLPLVAHLPARRRIRLLAVIPEAPGLVCAGEHQEVCEGNRVGAREPEHVDEVVTSLGNGAMVDQGPVVAQHQHLIEQVHHVRRWLQEGDDGCVVEDLAVVADGLDDVVGGRRVQPCRYLVHAVHHGRPYQLLSDGQPLLLSTRQPSEDPIARDRVLAVLESNVVQDNVHPIPRVDPQVLGFSEIKPVLLRDLVHELGAGAVEGEVERLSHGQDRRVIVHLRGVGDDARQDAPCRMHAVEAHASREVEA
eukprot:764363-Hanusia_phi.AAC.5